jgi:integrase
MILQRFLKLSSKISKKIEFLFTHSPNKKYWFKKASRITLSNPMILNAEGKGCEMQGTTPQLLTLQEMAYTLEIHPYTLDALVHSGLIPHTYIQPPDSTVQQLRFNPRLVLAWLQTAPRIEDMTGKDYLDSLREQYRMFTTAVQSLKTLDTQFSPKRIAKGYSLSKVSNKKYGFLYYVRYIENGKLVYSRWNTHTNNRPAAEQFAVENRERILNEYHEKRQPQNANAHLYHILKNYYKKDSPYLDEAKQRGRTINPKTRTVYFNFIKNVFIPFLRSNRVSSFSDITPPLISKFQTLLLNKGNKPQTINHNIGGVIAIFKHLVMSGIITDNVFDKITRLKEKARDAKLRGCYEIDTLAGVFNRKWHEELEYYLDLIIYTTDMRNGEIERIQPRDIIKIKDCHFIDIPESKTINGHRIVPLHPFVHEKLAAYINKYQIPGDGYLFSPSGKPNQSYVYRSAKLVLGEKLYQKLGIKLCDVEKYLDEQGITFYSGRHFWKTLMNANGLGDVEEYFMGHKVSSDVAKRYNHRDKQGQAMLLKKAREVHKILDKWVFN